ncbi:uncharacterized protein LOC111049287 isoform X2 [Nilaparvata lugens]|uniref:uncharacterized protein LOC111049287 isoform X2 n=1 Tax=Nilaparvata lugens TaxID=108931 RepID=UPI00193E1023|nr:uncharacterized protein LOC111049287 isoform X2 [Nilaparvata lugens]
MGRRLFLLLVLEICLFIDINCVADSRTHHGEECSELQVSPIPELHRFGQTFTNLASGLDQIPQNLTGDVILFVGNTGAGKSSLVHILGGEGTKFEAKDIGNDTGDYYIEDTSGRFVRNTTIDSTTTYPEAVVDATSGVILFDTPGFQDTRSAIHEIVATFGLRSVAEKSKRIKIALLVNHNSLTRSGPRDDFTKMLGSYFSLFNNTQKFQDNTYLIATKTPNQYIVKRGKLVVVSAESLIDSIVQFMNGVSNTLENHKGGNYSNEKFIRNAQALIPRLQGKIALFMKPDDSGPILESHSIRQSIESIRQLLLGKEGYVEVEVGDFGFAVSDTAKMYIKDLYAHMNNHMVEVSKSFVASFRKFLTINYKVFEDIEKISKHLQSTEQQINMLIQESKMIATPGDYVDILMNLADEINMKFCSNHVFSEIKQLDGYLDSLKKITDHDHYTSSKWSDPLYSLEHSVQNEKMFYNFLKNLYGKITDYSVMFKDTTITEMKNSALSSDVGTIEKFIKHLELDQFSGAISPDRIEEINSLLKNVVGNESTTCYQSYTMVVGSVLRTSEIDSKKISKCQLTNTVVVVALRKLYIDADILLKGMNMVVIAPEWHVMGQFTLSVDGENAPDPNWSHALPESHGNDGTPGTSAGHFVGIALRYFNSNKLTISATGGNGARGQDGGDGIDGRDGKDGVHAKQQIDGGLGYYVVYGWGKDKYLRKGDYGLAGSDAGQGGRGGQGGSSGTIKMYSFSSSSPDHSTHHLLDGAKGSDGENGRPGKGGYRGCDIIEEEYAAVYFILPKIEKKTYFQNCDERRNADGKIRLRSSKTQQKSVTVAPPPSICSLYQEVKLLYQDNHDIVSYSTNIEFQEEFQKQFEC